MASKLPSIRDVFGGLKSTFQTKVAPLHKKYRESPFIQGFNQKINQPVYDIASEVLSKGANIPRFQISRELVGRAIPATQTPTGQVLTNIALGIPESILNIPRNLTVGYSRLQKENLDRIRQAALGQKVTPGWQNIVTGVAPLAEAGLDIASFGVASGVAKQGGKELVKGGVKQAFKQGAKAGALYGGLGGLTYGAGEQYGKKFNLSEVAGTTLMGASLGGILGGGISSLGALRRLFQYDEEVLKGLRNYKGQYKPGQKLIKPANMPLAQWKSQLAVNDKLGRNPYMPVYPKDLQKAIDMGLSVKKLTKFQHEEFQAKGIKPAIPKELEPLAEEARKYKSAEEFERFLDEQTTFRPISIDEWLKRKGLNRMQVEPTDADMANMIGGLGMETSGRGVAKNRALWTKMNNWNKLQDQYKADVAMRVATEEVNPEIGRMVENMFKMGMDTTDFYTQATKGIKIGWSDVEWAKNKKPLSEIPTPVLEQRLEQRISGGEATDIQLELKRRLVAQQPIKLADIKKAQISPTKAQTYRLPQETAKTEPVKIRFPGEVNISAGGRQLGGAEIPPSAPIISDKDLISRLTKAIKEAKPIRGVQEAELYKKARSQKLAKLMTAREKFAGEKGYYEELGALKGELPKAQYETIRNEFTQENVDRLFNIIKEHRALGDWEKLNAQTGLAKMLGEKGGGVPTKNELALLDKVFGKEFTEAVLSRRPLLEKIGDLGMQLYNLPRSMMAGVADFSGTLMQNLVFAYRHPVLTGKNFARELKMFTNESYYKASMEEIAQRPTYEAMKQGRVSLTEVSPVVTAREEQFMSSLAEKIPGFGKLVRATGRAWTGFLNRMRADVFDQIYNSAKTTGVEVDNPTFLKSLGDFVNSGTGRGSLGKLERSANVLSQGLFSARKLVATANLINPVWYVKADPFVRKEALRTMLSFVSGGMAIVSLADLIPGVEVGKDPTSADFGKIKIGNTRFNVFGTYQQMAVLIARLYKGYATSSTTGRKMMLGDENNPYAPTRLDLLTRFFESKEHPTLSLIFGALRGQNQIGQPFNLPTETLNRFIPMILADSYDLYKEHGPVGLLGTIPAILGIPTQTYGSQIPSIEQTPTGKPKIKLTNTGGLAEDVWAKVTGAPVSNVPESQWPELVKAKETETQLKIQTEEAKRLLESGKTSKEMQLTTLPIKGVETSGYLVGDKFLYVNDEGEYKTLKIPSPEDFVVKEPEWTGNPTLDKELRADYRGAITKAKNSVMTALELGIITQEEAIATLENLKAQSDATKSAKKPKFKKVTFEAPKLGEVKMSSTLKNFKLSDIKTPEIKTPSLKVSKGSYTLRATPRIKAPIRLQGK